MTDKVNLSNTEWKQRLTPVQFEILRLKGTERAGTGEYNKHYKEGTYVCAGCKTPLYTSETKFDSGCGWPAFYDAIPGAIKAIPDPDGRRTEIVCAACDGHMGHVFKGEGFKTPTDERHCVNSVSLVFHAGEAPLSNERHVVHLAFAECTRPVEPNAAPRRASLSTLAHLPNRPHPIATHIVEMAQQQQQEQVNLSDAQWKTQLTPLQYEVLRLKGTEPAGSGEYDHHFEKGTYVCAGCKAPLYTSDKKFDSGCGWPAFYDVLPGAIKTIQSAASLSALRATAAHKKSLCLDADSHMGHVILGEGYKTPTDERHCINSVSIVFHPEDSPDSKAASE